MEVIMNDIAKAWHAECGYILTDLIGVLWYDHPDCWDTDQPLMRDWEWYRDNAEKYTSLPSDMLLGPQSRTTYYLRKPIDWAMAAVYSTPQSSVFGRK